MNGTVILLKFSFEDWKLSRRVPLRAYSQLDCISDQPAVSFKQERMILAHSPLLQARLGEKPKSQCIVSFFHHSTVDTVSFTIK